MNKENERILNMSLEEREKEADIAEFGLTDDMFTYDNQKHGLGKKILSAINLISSSIFIVVAFIVKCLTNSFIVWVFALWQAITFAMKNKFITNFLSNLSERRGVNFYFIGFSFLTILAILFVLFAIFAGTMVTDYFYNVAEDAIDDAIYDITKNYCILTNKPVKYRYPRKLISQRKRYYQIIELQAEKFKKLKIQALETNIDNMGIALVMLRRAAIMDMMIHFGPNFLTNKFLKKYIELHPIYKRIFMDEGLAKMDADMHKVEDNLLMTNFNTLGDNWKYDGMVRHMTTQDAMDMLAIKDTNYTVTDVNIAKEKLTKFYIKECGYNSPMIYRINYASTLLNIWLEKRNDLKKEHLKIDSTNDFMTDL